MNRKNSEIANNFKTEPLSHAGESQQESSGTRRSCPSPLLREAAPASAPLTPSLSANAAIAHCHYRKNALSDIYR